MFNVDALAIAVDFDPPSPIEALIINAARLPQIAPFGRVELEEVRLQFNVSALGPYELIRSVWRRHFRPQHRGHLIVLSTAGLELPPTPGMAGYIVGKAALEAVVSCATSEYGSGGLATTVIRPNYIDTPLLRAFEPRFIQLLREKNRVISPAQVASVVVDAANNPPTAGEYIIRKT
jgi:NAD(P)-dependent dehydrogenase (short-subunit alcohol dehydrogenase family)